MEDLISRKALISHIESQRREWGEDYDVEQILGDIEDFETVSIKVKIDMDMPYYLNSHVHRTQR
ncbi:MAG: hypothetical protein NC225_12235 [Clostridium sp.]|nr:hypothetical protein [Clostridium sp.]MCM1400237.1 hypothetical protein [Clostridium sp.]MCM1460950.1 hypothetical protein [Bacteroides sp.]